jgi:hypothetical protein
MSDYPKLQLPLMLGAWLLLTGGMWLLARRQGAATVGGPLIYVALLSLIHFFGAAIYAFPWYSPQSAYLVQQESHPDYVIRGFELSLLGLAAFCAGAVFTHWKCRSDKATGRRWRVDHRWLIGLGLIMKVVLTPILGDVPSMSSVLWIGSQLTVVGFLLAAWRCWLRHQIYICIGWIAASFLFPLSTTLGSGFIGHGMTSLVIILLFVQRYIRRHLLVGALGLVAIYLGMSIWVTYARDRSDVREVIWGGASLGDRISRAGETTSRFEFLDFYDQGHLESIDGRLNQNLLIGQAAANMEAGGVAAANGSTIAFALVAWIPRAIWFGKPDFGGSGTMVSTYTGRYFSETSSFGVGQIMEFYINFKDYGVLFGMGALGVLIAFMDRQSAVNLERGDSWGFVLWFLPMMGVIQPGGALAEIVASAAAAGVLLAILHLTRAYTFGIHEIVSEKKHSVSSFGTGSLQAMRTLQSVDARLNNREHP